MSTEDNKALVRRFHEEVFNQKNIAAIDDLCDSNFVDHSLPPGLPSGRRIRRRSEFCQCLPAQLEPAIGSERRAASGEVAHADAPTARCAP